jgi:hypothetical protein
MRIRFWLQMGLVFALGCGDARVGARDAPAAHDRADSDWFRFAHLDLDFSELESDIIRALAGLQAAREWSHQDIEPQELKGATRLVFADDAPAFTDHMDSDRHWVVRAAALLENGQECTASSTVFPSEEHRGILLRAKLPEHLSEGSSQLKVYIHSDWDGIVKQALTLTMQSSNGTRGILVRCTSVDPVSENDWARIVAADMQNEEADAPQPDAKQLKPNPR